MSETKEKPAWHGIPRADVPWFPTIDPEACIGCQLCYVTCGRSVYEMHDALAVAVDPMNCAVGCSTSGPGSTSSAGSGSPTPTSTLRTSRTPRPSPAASFVPVQNRRMSHKPPRMGCQRGAAGFCLNLHGVHALAWQT